MRKLLLAFHAETYEPVDGCPVEYVDCALSVTPDAPGFEDVDEFIPRQLFSPLKRFRQDGFTASERCAVQTELTIPERGTGDDAFRKQLKNPAYASCLNEMERPAHRPGANDGSSGNGLLDVGFVGSGEPESYGPYASIIILRLNPAHMRDYAGGSLEIRSDEPMVEQPLARYVQNAGRFQAKTPWTNLPSAKETGKRGIMTAAKPSAPSTRIL